VVARFGWRRNYSSTSRSCGDVNIYILIEYYNREHAEIRKDGVAKALCSETIMLLGLGQKMTYN
jgi:hypothetical protein